jgi:hypothetical protein
MPCNWETEKEIAIANLMESEQSKMGLVLAVEL